MLQMRAAARADSRARPGTKQEGGEFGSAASSRPPRKPLWRVSVFGPLSAMMRFVLCDIGRCVYCLLPLVLSVPVFVLIYQSGLRAEPILLGYTIYSDIFVDASALQDRTLYGGGRKAPWYQGLLGCLLRRRRGSPWAPPPCVVLLKASCFLFCLGSLGTNSLIGFLYTSVLWGNLSATLSPSSFGPFLASLSVDPLELSGCFWDTTISLSCSGTLSSLLSYQD